MDSAGTIVFSKDQPAATISKQVSRGELVRLARGVYTTEVDRDPADVVREHAFDIVGQMFPDDVITDRCARTGAPVDGVLYLAHPTRARAMELPGLKVRARTGAGPQPGDIPLSRRTPSCQQGTWPRRELPAVPHSWRRNTTYARRSRTRRLD